MASISQMDDKAEVLSNPVGAESSRPHDTSRVRPADSGAALINPGMGWMLYYDDEGIGAYGGKLQASDTVDDFPGLSVVYFRLPWCLLEPAEGSFQWAIVDTPAQRWIAKGKQVALRFTCTESNSPYNYATPKWVKDAGARGNYFEPGKGIVPGGTLWEPDYNDPIFLEKLSNFLASAAARYDGDPSVAFVDVGSFGVWGEGHNFWSSKLAYDASTVRRHIDLYKQHFQKTLLAANDDFSAHERGADIIEYARERGLTLRDDSILVQKGEKAYFSQGLAQAFWPNVPVILETEHYGPSKREGNWGDGSMYLQAVEDYHASYASIHWWPREFLSENRDLIRRINLRLGYRLQIVDVEWPSVLTGAYGEEFRYTIRNAGVAPCLPGGHVAFTLIDERGGVAAVFTDERLNVRLLPPGAAGDARQFDSAARASLIPNLRPGKYDVYISVGSRIGSPQIELPLAAGDGHKRYKLGEVTVQAGAPATRS